ncbi:MAG: gamma-glutamylcyclotransferase [Pseudomonadota bacterium]
MTRPTDMPVTGPAATTRLAVYGTLAPGQINHDQLAHLSGCWTKGSVRGQLVNHGWGADHGCPGLRLDGASGLIDVSILTSDDLPSFWKTLDAFEGDGYRRVVTQAQTEHGALDVHIYEVKL